MKDKSIANQRIRNMTTGIIHTNKKDLLEDAMYITRKHGIQDEDIACILKAIKPFLMEKIKDIKFWNEKLDTSHDGETEVPQMTDKEKRTC